MDEAHSTITARIVESFDRFAASYDGYSALQVDVAETLLGSARDLDPQSILDIGCGTGHVSVLASRLWPRARITALDAAPGMLEIVCRKAPGVRIVQSDASDIRLNEKFDLIFSSMMLHWLREPEHVVDLWRRLLTPEGRLLVAVPVQGSLEKWREICSAADISDPTWAFPSETFLNRLAVTRRIIDHPVRYANLHTFLDSMKKTGARTSNPDVPRIAIASLRRAIKRNDGAFLSTFRVLYADTGQR